MFVKTKLDHVLRNISLYLALDFSECIQLTSLWPIEVQKVNVNMFLDPTTYSILLAIILFINKEYVNILIS